MRKLEQFFINNRRWASQQEPGFFQELARQQSPRHLWIGCSDSRVPANQIVGLQPGELFVHRNVANLVLQSDLNCLSVLQYAIEVLHVQHVIVCGHYGCGGVQAVWQDRSLGLIDNWLRSTQDVMRTHAAELAAAPDERAGIDRLCELNVIEQVASVCRTTIVRAAWERGEKLSVHGWIYRLEDGLLRDLSLCVTARDELREMRRLALECTSFAARPENATGRAPA